MTCRLSHLVLVIVLGALPVATSLALIDSRQGPADDEFLLMQRHNAQSAPSFNAAASRQAELERRNQEVRDALSLPPVGWAHYDHPPALNAPAATAVPPTFSAKSDNSWWLMLLGSLLLGAGITFATAFFTRRQVPAASGGPKPRTTRHDEPYDLS